MTAKNDAGSGPQSGLDTDHLRSWIGREQVLGDVLTPALAERFHATLGLPGEAPRAGEPAPRLIHFCLALEAAPTGLLGPDGHPPRGGFLPPVPLPRRMWAAGNLAFSGDLAVGDTVRRTSRVADVSVKAGRSGVLCFVEVEHEISVGGAARVTERQTIVYRDAPSGGSAPAATPVPAPCGSASAEIEADARLLFRYSALTFNSHRIHYDLPYAQNEEGYPGLVVHGPLQATLLYHFAAQQQGCPPAAFAFRSVAPLFDGEPVLLHASPVPDGLALWTAAPGGPYGMRADARWEDL